MRLATSESEWESVQVPGWVVPHWEVVAGAITVVLLRLVGLHSPARHYFCAKGVPEWCGGVGIHRNRCGRVGVIRQISAKVVQV